MWVSNEWINGTPGPFDGPQWPFLAPRGTYTSVAVLMGLVMVSAAVVNGLVIVVSVQYKRLRSPLNYILVNLAVADLLVTFFGSTISFANNIYGFFVFGPTACEFEGFMVSLTGIVGLWSLAILAFERYLVICKPVGDFRFQQRHAVIGCAFTWLWSLLWTLPPLFGWSSYIPEGLRTSCGPNWYTGGSDNNSYILTLFVTCFVTPLATIVFSYANLLLTLRAVAAQQKELETTQRAEREVTRMVITMVMAFLVCWLPYASFAMVVATNKDLFIQPALASLPSYFSKTATVYNPIIYVFMNKQMSATLSYTLKMEAYLLTSQAPTSAYEFRSCLLSTMSCGRRPVAAQGTTPAMISSPRGLTSALEGSRNKVVPSASEGSGNDAVTS